MEIRRYKLGCSDGSLNATLSNLDAFQAVRRGRCRAVFFSTLLTSITAGCKVVLQVSKRATIDYVASQSAYGGLITEVLAEQVFSGNFVTSGLAQLQGGLYVPCNDPIIVGDSIYMHAYIAGTVVVNTTATVIIEE